MQNFNLYKVYFYILVKDLNTSSTTNFLSTPLKTKTKIQKCDLRNTAHKLDNSLYLYLYIYIILCLLNKHDKCNVSKLAVTIKIQYLCVLKVHRIKTAKQKNKNRPK